MKTDITALPPKNQQWCTPAIKCSARAKEMAEAEDISVSHQFKNINDWVVERLISEIIAESRDD
uniref:Uncharacterized protein n=1 Tax=Klebsiella pneumoniae TaxID=573 RepID=A0A8B0SS54_KLEPN|nr:hypothetical protein [Klebsiella pneumoniae]